MANNCETCDDFYDVEKYPTVIWECEIQTLELLLA